MGRGRVGLAALTAARLRPLRALAARLAVYSQGLPGAAHQAGQAGPEMRPPPSSPRVEAFPWGRVALAWLLLCGLLLAVNALMGYAGRFLDPDDTMRLVQVRDLLSGQGWFDLHQYRIDPPHSPVMHWSRIVDAPLALVILVLTPVLGQAQAETVAAVVIPLLTLGGIVLVVARMAFRLFGARVALIACFVCGLIPLMVAQVRPMRIDHHGWQIFTVVLAASALLSTSRARGGWLAGLALATGMTISLEVLPFAAAFAAVLALRWLVDREDRWWLVHFLVALATGLGVLGLLTRGFAGGTIYCDVVGVPHLAFFALVALAAVAISRTPSLPAMAALGLLGVAGAAGLWLFVAIAPQCEGGPFATLNPVVHDFWYLRVLEGQPIWRQAMPGALGPLFQALVALGALAVLWRRAVGPDRKWWLSYLLLFCASLAAGLLVWRSIAFTGALSVLPLAWLANSLWDKFKASRGLPHAAVRQAVIGFGGLAMLMPFAVLKLAGPLFPSHAEPTSPNLSDCDLAHSARLLNAFPPTKVFAPMDIGPDILAHTRDSVVATAHHRAQAAMRDVILAFLGSPETAHAIVTAHHAGLLVICTDLPETKQYIANAPRGLMAQLVQGKMPPWLQPVAVSGPNSFRVWRVVD